MNIVPPVKQETSWSHDIRGMVIFMGYGRTGSSLVAALLDAHPKVVITNEFNLLGHLHDETGHSYSAGQIYNALFSISKQQAESRTSGGGYSYTIPGQWQGQVRGKRPALIGDKKAEDTSGLGTENLTKALRELTAITRLPLKLIYVGRNPYENFATRSIKSRYDRNNDVEQKYFDLVESGKMAPEDMSGFMGGKFMQHYFELAKTNQEIMDILKKNPNYFGTPAEVVEIDYEDLVRDAPSTMHRVCGQLGIKCAEDYIKAATDLIWPTYHYTRFDVVFGQRNICEIMKNSLEIPHLRHYMLSSTILPPSSKVSCGTECFPGSSPCPCNLNDIQSKCQNFSA